MSNGAAIAFSINFDHQGQCLSVTFDGKTVDWATWDALQTTPINGLSAVSIVEILTANSCFVHHGCRQIKVC
jgi:hypothetical protein